MANVFAGAVRKWGRPAVEIEQAVIDCGERATNSLRRYLRVFYGITTVGPLLGLMGTVLGMIQTFNVIAAGDALGRTELLAGGIAKALLNTAGGLAVAIPASILYVFFVSRIDRLIIEIDALAQEVVNTDLRRGIAGATAHAVQDARVPPEDARRRLAAGTWMPRTKSAMPLKTHLDEPPTLNLTAMLDVMFLLIIFFMLGTRFADAERRIALRVPDGGRPRRPGRRRERKTVNVYRDGTITLDQSR